MYIILEKSIKNYTIYIYTSELKDIVIIIYYVGAIRTLNSKYQKFMTCQLVDNIYRWQDLNL